ncbi:multiple epidermal growth factor-like domains protein 10 [Ostrea edulis]|uniref:multiple epidermal growth factor-like domains protein 10 n=1 Tax=Ostrea edulis TaxID=37623 RepID=UPI0024AFA7E6|nr:multiple epidermal growth factor-like domains protein 10 [Ostrea edulis]
MDVFIIILLSQILYSYGYDDISKNQYAVQSTTSYCVPQSNCVADNAVDGIYSTCMKANIIGTTTSDKTVWWSVDLGNIHSIYSVSILFKDYGSQYEKRQQGRFAGFSLYLSEAGVRDSDSRCYVDGPELPPLNFTTTCVGYGRYVTFYNERLHGKQYPTGYETSTVFTELCEIIVKGCHKPGVYGSSCNIPCPENCQDKICNIVNGTCFGCLPGWTGALCENNCQQGWYGQDCKNQCSGYCRGKATCNHVSGNCDNGCAAGWMSSKCDKQCIAGTYGSDCIYNCSGHCQNDVICNRETGHCDKGCKPGYTGYFCNELCSPGRFGDRCDERCSGHCLNDNVCHHVDGICTDGCKDGYIGKWCNKSCEHGFFGTNCSGACPENCIDKCRHTDGFCECPAGYKGPYCNITYVGSFEINCVHKCSEHCVNNTCDKFNGSCTSKCSDSFHDGKCDQDPTSDAAQEFILPASWIVGFTVSVTLNVLLLIIVFFKLRQRPIQKECNTRRSDVIHYTFTDCIQNESEDTSTDHHRYQELNLTRDENLYQEIQSQCDITKDKSAAL